METLSFVSQKPFSLQIIESAISQNPRLRVEASRRNTLIVHGAKSRAYLHLDENSPEPGVFCLLVDYSEVELAKNLLTAFANDHQLIVDNDFGVVLPGNEFVARRAPEDRWDWLR
jgi:hypothetical protein